MTDFNPNKVYTTIYTVDTLLNRVYETLILDKERAKIERPKIIIKNKKSYIINFIQMAETINRSPEELQTYFNEELRVTTAFKENKSLKIDKIIKQQMIESIFKSYITNHVVCKTCKSHKTHIEKDKRIKYLICSACGCKKSVSTTI